MERGIIKTPLPPFETFTDDPLRVLRCIRFASRLGYEIATEDQTAMKDASIKTALKMKISRERVGVELIKMLNGKFCSLTWGRFEANIVIFTRSKCARGDLPH